MENKKLPIKRLRKNYGLKIGIPKIKLEKEHHCYGCHLYDKHNSVLFCPYPTCMRKEVEKGKKK